jgi:hypothetical protein
MKTHDSAQTPRTLSTLPQFVGALLVVSAPGRQPLAMKLSYWWPVD